MRRAAKVDRNQSEVVAELRKRGCSVAHTHTVGKGFPDLVVAYRGINYLVELKDPDKVPSARKLTADEQGFFDSWDGVRMVIHTADEFFKRIGHG